MFLIGCINGVIWLVPPLVSINFDFFKIIVYNLNNFSFNLIILSCFLLCYHRLTQKALTKLLSFIVFIAYSNVLNYMSYSVDYIKFTPGLLIGWVLVHPMLFYSGVLNFITRQILLRSYQNKIILYNILLKLILALVLGGYWGWSLGLWGFYWVYDFIEILLLALVFYVIYFVHKRFMFYKYSCFMLLVWVLLLVSLRFGFIPSRHSFFSKLSTQNMLIITLFGYYSFINSFWKFKVDCIRILVNALAAYLLIYDNQALIVYIFIVLFKNLNAFNFFYKVSYSASMHLMFYFAFMLLVIKLTNYFYYISAQCGSFVNNSWGVVTLSTILDSSQPKLQQISLNCTEYKLNLDELICTLQQKFYFYVNYIIMQPKSLSNKLIVKNVIYDYNAGNIILV